MNGPFLRDWSRVQMDRDLRLHPLLLANDYIVGGWSIYAYAFCKVEEDVTRSAIDGICRDLEVRLHHALRST